MKKSMQLLLLAVTVFSSLTYAQDFKPGFDPLEYRELMYISARAGTDTSYANKFPAPGKFKLIYQSPVSGLDNLWNLWISGDKQAVINLRGTTRQAISWTENFYAAMVPAHGSLQIGENDRFDYHLSDDNKASVHTGWLVGLAFLSKDIIPKIDSLYKSGIRNFYIVGHSQGGAIAFLLTSHLHYLRQQQSLPSDIRFKTYCSAAPKPGNLFYAYDFESITREGWAYNVVNSADWVPETPFSIQTIRDFNRTNPFKGAKKMLKKQKFPKNLVLTHVYNRMDKATDKARRKYEKYLGRYVSKAVGKSISGFKAPVYFKSMNYVRTGVTVVLAPGKDYYVQFPDNEKEVFTHHLHQAYLYLLQKQYGLQ